MSQSFIQGGATVSHSGRLRKHLSARLSRRLLVGLIGASLATGAVLPSTVFAQSTNATLRGTAPPSTEITALNTATGATRHTKSNAQVNYTLVVCRRAPGPSVRAQARRARSPCRSPRPRP
jgi:hypothetical protein